MPSPIDVHRLTRELPTSQGWEEVVHLEVVGSTNDEAAARARAWSPVLAELQTAGRGRLGRTWQERPSNGLALSVVVPPVPDPGWLPLVAGLAVRTAVSDLGVETVLKWPNDVLAPGDEHRKLCGILCQLLPRGAGVVVGIGVNVHQDREQLPVPTATSLRLLGASVDRTDLAAAVLHHLRQVHAALDHGGARAQEVRDVYREACATVGMRVDVHRPDGSVEEVVAAAVDDEGRLLVEGPDGSATVSAGDVQHIRPAGVRPRD